MQRWSPRGNAPSRWSGWTRSPPRTSSTWPRPAWSPSKGAAAGSATRASSTTAPRACSSIGGSRWCRLWRARPSISPTAPGSGRRWRICGMRTRRSTCGSCAGCSPASASGRTSRISRSRPSPTSRIRPGGSGRSGSSGFAPALKAIADDAANPDPLSALAWRRFFDSASWFAFTDRHGPTAGWLASDDDRLAGAAVGYLRRHHRHAPRSGRRPARAVCRSRRRVDPAAARLHGAGRPPREPPPLRAVPAPRRQRRAGRGPRADRAERHVLEHGPGPGRAAPRVGAGGRGAPLPPAPGRAAGHGPGPGRPRAAGLRRPRGGAVRAGRRARARRLRGARAGPGARFLGRHADRRQSAAARRRVADRRQDGVSGGRPCLPRRAGGGAGGRRARRRQGPGGHRRRPAPSRDPRREPSAAGAVRGIGRPARGRGGDVAVRRVVAFPVRFLRQPAVVRDGDDSGRGRSLRHRVARTSRARVARVRGSRRARPPRLPAGRAGPSGPALGAAGRAAQRRCERGRAGARAQVREGRGQSADDLRRFGRAPDRPACRRDHERRAVARGHRAAPPQGPGPGIARRSQGKRMGAGRAPRSARRRGPRPLRAARAEAASERASGVPGPGTGRAEDRRRPARHQAPALSEGLRGLARRLRAFDRRRAREHPRAAAERRRAHAPLARHRARGPRHDRMAGGRGRHRHRARRRGRRHPQADRRGRRLHLPVPGHARPPDPGPERLRAGVRRGGGPGPSPTAIRPSA